MRPTSFRRLSRSLLIRASRGDEELLAKLERRVTELRRGDRLDLAGLMGAPTSEQRVVLAWLDDGFRCHPNDLSVRRISEKAQARVLDLVYPLVARYESVNSATVRRAVPSPMTLAVVLRLNRELLGDPKVGGGRMSPLCNVCGLADYVVGEPREDQAERGEGSIRLLVEAGADLEQRDVSGVTPLQFFCRDFPECLFAIKALIRCGADVQAKDSFGCNILHILARRSAVSRDSELAVVRFMMNTIPAATLRAMLEVRHAVDGLRPYELAPGAMVDEDFRPRVLVELLAAARGLGLEP